MFDLQVEIEGLTGDIRFTDDGRRRNYTLDVMEMTIHSAKVKVSLLMFLGIQKITDSEVNLWIEVGSNLK